MIYPTVKASALCLFMLILFAPAKLALADSSSGEDKPAALAAALHFNPSPGVAPATDAQVQSAASAIEKLAQKEVDEAAVPGLAIAIVHHDKLVLARGFGVREMGKSDKVDADTVFQLASVSKSLASTVVASLVAQGQINWDSKVFELDPNFAMYDPWVTRQLTIRDLFCHRSGLPDHAGDVLEDLGYDRDQVLYRLRYQKPDSSMRSAYAYTNFGFSEGAFAAARAYKTEWQDACEEQLYKPLGMTSTSSRYQDFMARPNKALAHVSINGKWVHKFQRQPDPQAPAGGVSSSVNDLSKWMRMQIADGKFEGKQLIPQEPLSETHHPHMLTGFSPITGLPEFYGLGFNVNYDQSGRLHLGHSGAFCLGAATKMEMIPSEKLGIVVLTNAYPVGVAEGIAATFTDLALNGKPTQDWLSLFKQLFANPATLGVKPNGDYSRPPSPGTSALKDSAYVGVYANKYLGDLEIIEKDGGLACVIGPKKATFSMKHFDADIFTYEAQTENLSGVSGLHFTIGPEEKAVSVVVENLNDDGQGRFVRADHLPNSSTR